jgi:hypothetical protein
MPKKATKYVDSILNIDPLVIFLKTVNYVFADHKDKINNFMEAFRTYLNVYFNLIEELEKPINQAEVVDALDAAEEEAFKELAKTWKTYVSEADLNRLRKDASAVRTVYGRKEFLNKLAEVA